MSDAKDKSADRILILLLLILLVAVCLFYLRITPYGVGLVSDSVNYINGARSIAAGNGYFRETGGNQLRPITNFPPLYSITLALPIMSGVDGIVASRWYSLLFMLLNIILIALIVRRVSGSAAGAFAAALLFSVSTPFWYFQLFAMSEPLFFFCTLLALLLFYEAWRSQKAFFWFGCGIFCGLAFLARYIGIVSLCAFIAAILFLGTDWRMRRRAIISLLMGALPLLAVWFVRNILVSGNPANRQASAHWITNSDVNNGVMIFWRWVLNQRYQSVELALPWMSLALSILTLLAVAFLAAIWLYRLLKKRTVHTFLVVIWTCVIYILGYVLFVILTISLFDASVNIEERILYPAFMVMILIFSTVFGYGLQHRKLLLMLGGTLIFAFFFYSFSEAWLRTIPKFGGEGYGWAWDGWRTSPAMQILRKLPQQTEVYANQPEAVSLWAGRGAYALLDPIDPSNNQRRDGYDDTMQIIRQQVKNGTSVLVFFQVDSWLDQTGESNWVTELCDGLPFIYQDNSEWVVGVPDLLGDNHSPME